MQPSSAVLSMVECYELGLQPSCMHGGGQELHSCFGGGRGSQNH